MVKHLLISDTHAPDIIQDIYEDVKTRVLAEHNPDAIIINGDLLGIFSMAKSSVYKHTAVTYADKKRYLQLAAPKWYQKYGMPQILTQEMVLAYVKERYSWVTRILKQFSKLKKTLFNMGNHESPYHFLVLQELPFLLDTQLPVVSHTKLHNIFASHEQSLAMLEMTHDFVYIRNKPYLDDDVLCMPIPGESHDAVGEHMAAKQQEEKTKELIQIVKKQLDTAKHLVIYNHTQGDYDKTTATFRPASPAITRFLQELPNHLQHVVWVQSHNHWSYTQYLKDGHIHYVLNNAGLHEGIYNIIEITDTLHVYDVHTKTDTITELQVSDKSVSDQDALKIIARNYRNYMDIYLHRKMSLENSLNPKQGSKEN